MAYDYRDIPADCPFEWFWIVANNDGCVKRAKAFKVADAFPELEDSWKYDYGSWSDGHPVYDRENPWYMVPEGPYRTTRRFVYETPAEAALVALEQYRKTADRQEAILDSIHAALDGAEG